MDATINASARDLLARGITIQTRTLPESSPWRIHGAWVASVVVGGKIASQWLGETQDDAAGLAVEDAMERLVSRRDAVAS